MKIILDVNNAGRKYTYNAYSTILYEDGSISEDSRKLETDNLDEFIQKLKQFLQDSIEKESTNERN